MDAAEARATSDVVGKLNWDSRFPLEMKRFVTTPPLKRKPMNKTQKDHSSQWGDFGN